MIARPPARDECAHWDGAAGWFCGSKESTRFFLIGIRCPKHTPAAIAGRSEAVPDPARTMAGIRDAWQDQYAQTQEDQRRRAAGQKVFRRPSGPGGRYRSADISYAAVHRAGRAVGDILEQRRLAALTGSST